VLQAYWRPTTGSGNNYLDRIDYGYDYAGNRTYRNVRGDMIAGASVDERDQAYSYDGLHRVTDAEQGSANNTTGLISTKKFDQQWTLDQLGNWQEFDQDNNGDSTWDLEQSRTHNDANELTAIGLQSGGAGANWSDPAFDAAGNMTTIPQPGNLTTSYSGTFDAWNRLVSLDSGSTASYEYDGLNRRIKRVEGATTRHFYYTENWQCLEERATEAGTALKQFVWGAQYVDELVARDRDADNNSGNGLEERLYAVQDALYNVTGLVSTAGSVQERFGYTAYGESTVLNADMTVKGGGTGYAWEHRYTGRILDPTSGLQLNRNRYYHQQLGRWCSRDPIGYTDGMNLFGNYFVVNATDAFGLQSGIGLNPYQEVYTDETTTIVE
jgi:RHS repeat-associated protein